MSTAHDLRAVSFRVYQTVNNVYEHFEEAIHEASVLSYGKERIRKEFRI